jgi:hypothetical protein
VNSESRRTAGFHHSPLIIRHLLADDQGVAALEGVIAVAILVGIFLAALLLGQWGSSLQTAQMGARLLAFDAGDVQLAQLGKASNQAAQQLTSEAWDTLVNSTTASWLSGIFTLSNRDVAGSVSGVSRGRLPGRATLFAYVPATLGYNALNWAAECDPWAMSDTAVRTGFLRLAHHVGLYRVSPAGLDSTSAGAIPHADTVLEIIYGRVGL